MNLSHLGWDAAREREWSGYSLRSTSESVLFPARVAREDRGGYVVYADGRACRAVLSGSVRHRAVSPLDLPAVGDWVAIAPRDGGSRATIHGVLPRRSCVERRAAGARCAPQIIASNVDLLLLCMGLDADFNLRRLERYIAVAWASGAAPLVILTKADLCDDVTQRVAEVSAVAIGASVLAVSNQDGRGLAALVDLLGTGRTAALLGSSGVGKSSLINALLGRHELPVGAVRAGDGRGRHTTTRRELLLTPAGVIIDTPGMRELQLWLDPDEAQAGFDDIDAAAAECRFRDCTHQAEPGCGVRAAVARGALDAQRLASFQKLQREAQWLAAQEDPRLAQARRARWKVIHKAAQEHMRRKYGD